MTFPISTILKILLVEFVKSPMKTLMDIAGRFLPDKESSPQTALLQEIVRRTPLILQIETTNACNANCVFCAYPKMQRKRGVMSLSMFEQIIDEYTEMGGGPVSLTPLVGDALIDPHFMKRLQMLANAPKVSQVSMTTNGIAFHRYSDDEVRQILTVCDCSRSASAVLTRRLAERCTVSIVSPRFWKRCTECLRSGIRLTTRRTSTWLSVPTTGCSNFVFAGSWKLTVDAAPTSATSGLMRIIRGWYRATKA